jgi:hypothetical protein
MSEPSRAEIVDIVTYFQAVVEERVSHLPEDDQIIDIRALIAEIWTLIEKNGDHTYLMGKVRELVQSLKELKTR